MSRPRMKRYEFEQRLERLPLEKRRTILARLCSILFAGGNVVPINPKLRKLRRKDS